MEFIKIRPEDNPKEPGWRLRLEYHDVTDITFLANERVLPEKVNSPGANLVEGSDAFWLTRDEVRWLRDGLNELLAAWEKTR